MAYIKSIGNYLSRRLFVAEDFASDIHLSEEEQIKLLEQYENEKRNKNSGKTSTDSSEEILFEKQSPTKSKKSLPRNGSGDKIIENAKENHFNEDQAPLKTNNININKIDSATSLDTKSSNSSSDGDWEKISDIPE